VQERALARDATGREWPGWRVHGIEGCPDGHAAFAPDAPPDGDPDTIWFVPQDALRRVPDGPADRGAAG
jgi:hypothetical protein